MLKSFFLSNRAPILHLSKSSLAINILNRHKTLVNYKSGGWGQLKIGMARFQDLGIPNSPDFKISLEFSENQ